MKTKIMILMAMLLATGMLYGTAVGQSPPIPSEEQPEVLTQGPVNEAFAQPVSLDAQSSFTAPERPPAHIDEIPPSERPEGGQFAWVPGYWAWDSDRDGYIWVSGCWRAVPPGRYWVPGYWAQMEDGWQWAAGFWAPVGNQEISYLPAPPELTNVEAQGPPPSPDRIWVPPCWYWHQGQYIRRPGYWITAQPDWVWVPSHYIRTPRGYVFADGHWDYTLDRRGVLFAPIYFPNHSYERPGFSYGLSIVLNVGNLELSLFTRPSYGHYYFGDYYDSRYISIGIFPWFMFEQRHTWYDPIYVQNRWRRHRAEPQWERNQRREYDRRRDDRTLRPPRTYREMEKRMAKMPESRRRSFEIAEPVTRMATRKSEPFKFQQIKPEARKQIAKHSNDVHKFVQERSQWESKGPGHQDRNAVMEKTPVIKHKDRQPVEHKPDKSVMKVPPAVEHRVMPPVKHKRQEMKSPERMEQVPAQDSRRGQTPARGREEAATSSQRQKPSVSETGRNQPDKVKIRTSPVADKEGRGSSKKKPPTQPTEEEKDLSRKGKHE